MRQIIIISLALFVFASCNSTVQNKEDVISATIEKLVANPEEYRDMDLAVSGMVTHVCRHGGQKFFLVGEDGETQIRIVTGGDIDEFSVDLEGSMMAVRGTFRVMTAAENEALVEDHESKEHHQIEMSHSQAEKADIYLEAIELKEITD